LLLNNHRIKEKTTKEDTLYFDMYDNFLQKQNEKFLGQTKANQNYYQEIIIKEFLEAEQKKYGKIGSTWTFGSTQGNKCWKQ
jgi:hypothetical protein